MNRDVIYNFGEYTLRLIKKSDFENYYSNGFLKCSDETDYFTGTTKKHKKEDILNYINKIVDDKGRYDFVILDIKDNIIGEVVLNEVKDGWCNYRIAIFDKENYSKNIGYNASKFVLDYAISHTDIKIISLEVYPFNERAINLYKKLGFVFVKEIFDDEAEEMYRRSYYMEFSR